MCGLCVQWMPQKATTSHTSHGATLSNMKSPQPRHPPTPPPEWLPKLVSSGIGVDRTRKNPQTAHAAARSDMTYRKARLPSDAASVLAKALVPSGPGVLHSLLLALDPDLAHAAAQREVRCVRELPRLVRLPSPTLGDFRVFTRTHNALHHCMLHFPHLFPVTCLLPPAYRTAEPSHVLAISRSGCF